MTSQDNVEHLASGRTVRLPGWWSRRTARLLLHGYARFLTKNPWTVLILAVAFVLLLSTGCAFLTFRTDNRVFFAADNPELMALERFELLYDRSDTLLFVVNTTEGDLFTPERLRALIDLTDRAWLLPHVKRVDSFTNFQRVAAIGNDVTIDHLIRAGDPLTAGTARALKDAAFSEPLVMGRLLSADGRVALVAVTFRMDDDTAKAAAEPVMAAARDLIGATRAARPDLEVGLSGSIALDDAFLEAGAWDTSVLTPIMITVLLGVLVMTLRSPAGIVMTFVVIVLAIAAGLGIAGFLGVPLSAPSVVSPNIILTLATADCVHMCAIAMRLRSRGLGRRQAVRHVIVDTVPPVTLTSWLTIIGFLSLCFSPVPPFAHLGIIVSAGTLIAWLLSMSLLPAALCLLPWSGSARPLPARRLVAVVAQFVTRWPGPIAVTTLGAALALSGFAVTNRLDDRYVHYFSHNFEFRQATDRLNEDLGGFYVMEFSLDAGAPGGVSNPSYLADVAKFADWLRQQPGVTHVYGLSDVIRTINRAMEGGGAEAYALPRDRNVSAQFLALYEMSLPIGMDLKDRVTTDKAQSRLTVALGDMSTSEMVALADHTDTWIRDNAPALASSAQATGTPMLFAHIGMRNIEEMLKGTFAEIILISLLLFLFFRSFLLGFIGIVANLVPSLAALGGWAIVQGEVGMSVATIAAVTLGIVVDDTIHLLTAIKRSRRTPGLSIEQAVSDALCKVGPGMLATTLALAAGFGCLAFSGFQINAWMGLMTAIVILVAIGFDFLFLPATIIKCWR